MSRAGTLQVHQRGRPTLLRQGYAGQARVAPTSSSFIGRVARPHVPWVRMGNGSGARDPVGVGMVVCGCGCSPRRSESACRSFGSAVPWWPGPGGVRVTLLGVVVAVPEYGFEAKDARGISILWDSDCAVLRRTQSSTFPCAIQWEQSGDRHLNTSYSGRRAPAASAGHGD